LKYYIQRQLNEYGPYTLADLQRYVAQGSILLTDMARSEGMTEWAPLSTIIGNIPVQVTPQAMPSGVVSPSVGGTVYSGQVASPQVGNAYPIPPDLHWALVLLIGWFCGIFPLVWLFVQAGFVRKLNRESKFMTFMIAGLCIELGSFFVFFVAAGMTANNGEPSPIVFLLLLGVLGGTVLYIVGIFQMRSAIEDHYNSAEPINLRLSGVMTFFFNIYYFQYHFTRIANWKKTGMLQPQ